MKGHINKVIITGDIFRPEPEQNIIGNQNSNINWFYNIFKFFIENTIPSVPIESLLGISGHQKFDAEKFYRLNGLEISVKNWAKIYDLSSPENEAEEYFLNYFKNTFVIGFELPKIFKVLLDKHKIIYVEFITHPVRFLDDIFFGIDTNSELVKQKLDNFKLDEKVIYAMSSFRKAGLRRLKQLGIEENAALLIGQTNVDRSLISNGKLLTVFDYQQEIENILYKHKKLYFKPHPYQANSTQLNKFMNKIGAVFLEQNVYYLLTQNNFKTIYAISSSVIEESKYFGIKSEYLCKNIVTSYIPVFNHYFDSKFWKSIFECYFKTNDKFDFKIPNKANRLRDNLGWYWGFHIFEYDNLDNDIKRQKRKKYISKIYRLLSTSIFK